MRTFNNVHWARRVSDGGEDWRERAACAGDESDLHFPVGDSGPALLQIKEAKVVCGRCPSRASCLAWALEHRMEHGIWGGLTEQERRGLRPARGQRGGRPRLPLPPDAARAFRNGDTAASVARRFETTETTARRWRGEALQAEVKA